VAEVLQRISEANVWEIFPRFIQICKYHNDLAIDIGLKLKHFHALTGDTCTSVAPAHRGLQLAIPLKIRLLRPIPQGNT
jgi:hypothetical protein